jgi:tetratricopeptide (TPR) repeat protein
MAPRQPGLHEELGDQDWIAGQFEQAKQAYREELQIDPHCATSMYKLGSLLAQNQGPTEGVKLLRDALRADPSLADVHYQLACGLMEIDKVQEAIQEFQLAIAADPANDRAISAYYKLSQVYRKLHQPEEAQAAMQNFLRLRSLSKDRHDSSAAQIVRKRTELPVADPEESAMAATP